MKREAATYQPSRWARIRHRLERVPLAGVAHRVTTTLDGNLRRYNMAQWVPKDHVLNPRILETIHVWAHKQVNDLNRPGGFFDWTWNSRHPGISRPHLDYPQQSHFPRMAAAAAIPIGVSISYAAHEAMSKWGC